jgi:hypothetical protein
MNNNKKIIELFEELDALAEQPTPSVDEYATQYWDIKMRIVEEISRRYDCTYSPETLRILGIPCGIMSMIVEMERERLLL